jgi:hypothetical protein
MNTTDSTSKQNVTSTSRGFGRLAARTTVGAGPATDAQVAKARAEYPELSERAFRAGFADERREMR